MALYLDGNALRPLRLAELEGVDEALRHPPLGSSECPDMFPLPVDDDAARIKWVFWARQQQLPDRRFRRQQVHQGGRALPLQYGANYYAAQTYSNIPPSDGRRIQIAWMAGGKYPHMPFNQQMSLPGVLTLRTFPRASASAASRSRKSKRSTQAPFELGDVALEARRRSPGRHRGRVVRYPSGNGTRQRDRRWTDAPRHTHPLRLQDKATHLPWHFGALEPTAGKITLQVLVDRSSLEIFSGDGRVNMAYCISPRAEKKNLAVFAEGGPATVRSLEVWELKSIWSK